MNFKYKGEEKSMNKMNAYTINNSRSVVGKESFLSKGQETIFQKGQIISGIISRVSDMISINFSGKEVTVSKETIQQAEEGQIRQFEVMNASSQGIVLKEVGTAVYEGDISKATFTILQTEHLYKVNDNMDGLSDKESQTMEKKGQLESINSRMTKEDYKEISEEGVTLESYDLERLDRALARIKEFKNFKEDCRERVSQKEIELEDNMEKSAIAQAEQDGLSKRIVMRLEGANLPVTKENIERIEHAIKKAEVVKNISDQAITHLMKNGMEPTIQNIYIGNYSGNDKTQPMNEELLTQLQEQILPMVEEVNEQGYTVSLDDAKWLLERNIPLTQENLRSLQEMREIQEINDNDFVLDQIIDAMTKGNSPEAANMGNQNTIMVTQALNDFANITEEAVNKVLSQDLTLNLIHLKEALGAKPEEVKNTENVKEQTTTAQNADIKLISARRQLEEIRLKMTYEAGLKLMKKGVHLYTAELETIVNELKNIEDEYYHHLLSEGSVATSQNNLEIVKSTLERLDTLKTAPMYVLGETYGVKSHINLEQLSAIGERMQGEFQKANEAYESLMTSPRRDMGDTINKAFENIPDILNDLDLEVNEANIRAVKILGYNQMDISREAIFSMKEYDGQVQNLMENLHPAIAVQLIKDGNNPLYKPVEELNQEIQQIREDMGLTEDVKYSVFLQKLDKQQSLTNEERDAYIGIYRLLNNVEKTNGQAIGSLIKANREVTLGNLLSAIRTNKAKGLDTEIDDNYGMLTGLTYRSTTISDQLESAFKDGAYSEEEQHQLKYYNDLNSRAYDNVTPDKITRVLERDLTGDSKINNLLDTSLESFFQQMNTTTSTENMDYYEAKLEQIHELAKESEDALKFLNDYNLEDSINQIEAAKEFLKHDIAKFNQIKNLMDPTLEESGEKLLDSMENIESMKEAYEGFVDSVQVAIHYGFEGKSLSMEEAVNLNKLSSQADLMKKLSKQEYYEIPVEVDGEVVQIAVRFLSSKDHNSKVAIHMNSEAYGDIHGEFKFKDGEIKGFVVSTNTETLEQVKEVCNQLESQITGNGFKFSHLNFSVKSYEESTYRYENFGYEDETEKVETKDLYKFAKSFIRNIKTFLHKNEEIS